MTFVKQKNATKKQIKEYKMSEREIYKKFGNLSKDEFNAKINKNIYVRNDIMSTIIKYCRGKKKRGIRAVDRFRKKLMIPDFEIPRCSKYEVKSKIGKLFMSEKIFEEYSVKIYKIDPYFYGHHKEKMEVYKNGREYILFVIDVYFSKYILAVETDEKNHEGRELIF